MEKEKSKKIIIFSDLSRGNFLLARKIISYYPGDDVKIIFYSDNEGKFIDGDKVLESIDNFLLSADLFFNLIPVKKQASRDLEKRAELLKAKSIENSLGTRLLFFTKNNLKKLFKNFNIKSPVFSLLGNKEPAEVFASFPQPSRIFSKSNRFFSGKIDNIEKMKEVFAQLGENKADYLIEEYIEGSDIYSLVFKDEDLTKVYSLFKNVDPIIKEKLLSEVENTSKNIFKNFSIDKFALIHYRTNKTGSLYVLNIFTEIDILIGDKELILKDILSQEKKEIEDFLKSLEKNLPKREISVLNYMISGKKVSKTGDEN